MREHICEQCSASFTRYGEYRRFCSRACFYASGVAHRGHRHSPETIERLRQLSLSTPGVRAGWFTPGHKKWNHPNVRKHWRKKGQHPPNWQGGTRTLSEQLKDDRRYKGWRTSVFQRDHFTCQVCGVRGGYLEADHIKAKARYPELAFDVSNGRTLCAPCHRKTPNYGAKAMSS